MNNKITFPELVEQVAQYAHTSKRMSELFLKELFATISQSLIDGESVKVKGIGTFKLTDVSARKSVDVNTGEEIEIPGHKKLSFAPDKDLAEAINQPFMHFETEILDDAVTDEQLAAIDASDEVAPAEEKPASEQEPSEPEDGAEDASEQEVADESEQETADDEEVVMPPAFVLPEEKEEPEAAPADDAAEDAAPDTAEEVVPAEDTTPAQETEEPMPAPEATATEPADAATEPEVPIAEPQTPLEETQDTTDQPQTAEEESLPDADSGDEDGVVSEELADERVGQEVDKRRITRRSLFEGFVVGVVTTLIVTLFAYRLYLMKGYGASTDEKPKAEQALAADSAAHDSAKNAPQATLAQAKENAEKEQQAAQKKQAEEEAKKKAKNEAKAKEKADAVKGGAATTDTIKPGTNLYRMSRKHYGTDKFWVYIYEENKAKYPNPNAIPVGAVLRVPSLAKYGAKAGDAASLKAANKKQSEIFTHLNSKK